MLKWPPLLLPAPLPRFLLLPATACPPATGTATAQVPPSLSRLGLPPLTLLLPASVTAPLLLLLPRSPQACHAWACRP